MSTTDEQSSGSWDATQWHEVKKGETLWAKAGLAALNQSWTEASDAFKAGNMTDAVAKGTAAKTKAVEVMTALNMTVPEAAK